MKNTFSTSLKIKLLNQVLLQFTNYIHQYCTRCKKKSPNVMKDYLKSKADVHNIPMLSSNTTSFND